MTRSTYSWFVAMGLVIGLTGCGAVWVNLGAKNEPLTDGLKDPASMKALVVVPEEQRVISNFEDGTTGVNPKLINGGGGSWFTYGGAAVNNPFVVDGGANGTKKCAHVFGTLINKGDNQYPSFGLEVKPKSEGFYDAGAFSGICFYYKCPPADQTLYRRLTIPLAATIPTSGGGTCQDGCYNHFGADLPPSANWTLLKMAFSTFKRSAGWGSPVNPPDFTDHLAEIADFEWNNGSGNTAGTYGVDFWVDEVELY